MKPEKNREKLTHLEILKEENQLLKAGKSKLKTNEKNLLFARNFLSETALEFEELPFQSDIHSFIGEKLLELIGEGFVVISEYDEQSDSFKIKNITGKKKLLTELSKKFMKTDLYEISVPMNSLSDEGRAALSESKWYKVEDGLYEILGKQIPKKASIVAEKLLNIDEIYAVGFKWKEKTYGSANIFLTKKKKIEDFETLQAFINLASVALQRRKAEKLLNETKDRLSLITDNMLDIIGFIDNDGKVQYISPSYKKVLGKDPEHLRGKLPFSSIHPDDLENAVSEFQKNVTTKSSVQFQFRIKHANGKYIWAELNSNAISDEKGNTLGSVFSIRDINERKKVEEERNRIFNYSIDQLCVADFNCNFKELNPSWEKTLGWSKEELISKSYLNFVHPDDIESTRKAAESLSNGQKVISFDNRYKCKDGKYKWLSWNAYPLVDQKLIFAVARDVTHLKKAEKDLKMSLEEKEMLLKEIHHRVKNNLMVISSLLNLQSRYIKDPEALDVFKESQNRAKSMALIHERLYRSTDLKKIDFGDYIRTLATDLFRTYATDTSKIQLKMNVEDIQLDINTAIPLGLIVNELISNALKYAFPNDIEGSIVIDFHSHNNILTIKVKDNGIGFPENLDYKNTESLGLQLVNTLTKQIDGEIQLTKNQGTEFKITFKEITYN